MGSDKFRNTLIYENLNDEFRMKLLSFDFPFRFKSKNRLVSFY